MLNKITKANQNRQAIIKAVTLQSRPVLSGLSAPTHKMNVYENSNAAVLSNFQMQCFKMQENKDIMMATRRNFSLF